MPVRATHCPGRLRAELAAVFEGFEEAKLVRVPNIGSFRLTTVDDVDRLGHDSEMSAFSDPNGR